MTSYNGHALEYDAIGNPLTYRDGITLTWQNGRKLATFANADTSVAYTYDVDGLRTGKTVTKDGTATEYNYVYENGLLLQMTRGSRVYDFSYDANGTPVSIAYRNRATANPTYYYYGTNWRGDVVALYSSSGAITALYEYDAYGKVTVKSSNGQVNTSETHIANVNPLRYRGYVYDNETGFYYLQSRYYDPTTCRFVNADVYISTGVGFTGYNMFVYCNSSPIQYSDSQGTRLIVSASTEKETSLERKLSLDHMNRRKRKVVDITKKLDEYMKENAGKFISYVNTYNESIVYEDMLKPEVYFLFSVCDRGEYDIKLKPEWEFQENTIYCYRGKVLRYDDPGNINYGYIGATYFSEDVLCMAAGANQFSNYGFTYGSENWFDDPRDQYMIRYGYNRYWEDFYQ